MGRIKGKNLKKHCSFCRGGADLLLSNKKFARATWGAIPRIALNALEALTRENRLSIAAGDLKFLDGRWYVTHSGLLQIAQRKRCSGIRTELQGELCNPSNSYWVFKATVYRSPRSRVFVGYGDASPTNVASLARGAEMRVAETRAVNRALRKAYGVGLCSVEELGWAPRSDAPAPPRSQKAPPNGNNGRQNGQLRLRDRLCLLIRQYHLDAGLVKAYAADFCNAPSLREASKDQVEAFINDLARRAANDLPDLICQLNSYAKPSEVGS